MKRAENHKHPQNIREQVFGCLLEVGDVVEQDDVYASQNGRWYNVPKPGEQVAQNNTVIIVRPTSQVY